MHESSDPVILFAPKPVLNELCAVTVHCAATTLFTVTQPRILKCRELIFTEPDIIASPSTDYDGSFNIIMQQILFKSGRLQARLKSNNLQVSKPFRVTAAMYQTCLRYSVLAKLAPAWNKAGDWLIQGRDFITHSGCANAVKFDLMANADELYLSISAAVLRLCPLQLNDLNLSLLQVQGLLCSGSNQTGEVPLYDTWCHVLPSMKKGRLCSVSLSIPANSPFGAYTNLKRHWKNTYGYRLPDSDHDIFFAQVSFWKCGGKPFTYPSVCLRANSMQCVPRVETKPILSALLQDLHSKVPCVCGQPLRFQPHIRHAFPALYSAAEEVRGPGPNLCKKRSVSTAHGAPTLRNIVDLSHLYQDHSVQGASDVAKLKSFVDNSPATDLSNHSQHDTDPIDKRVSAPESSARVSDDLILQAPSSTPEFNTSTATVGIPQRRSSELQQPPKDESLSGAVCERGISPKALVRGEICRFSHQIYTASGPVIGRLSESNESTNTSFGSIAPGASESQGTSAASSLDFPRRIIPIFKSKTIPLERARKPSNTDVNHSHHDSSARIVPVFKRKPTKVLGLGSQKTPTPKESDTIDTVCPRTAPSRSNTSGQHLKSPPVQPQLTSPSPGCDRTVKNPCTKIPLAEKLKMKMIASKKKAVVQPSTASDGTPKCVKGMSPYCTLSVPSTPLSQDKRKADDRTGEQEPEVAKKARQKPRLQNVDVEQLVITNQLSKVNTVTLMSWLKDRGVHCKSKDKKGELVDRIKAFLALTSAES